VARTGTAEQHHDAQAALAATVVPLVAAAWVHFYDPHNITASIPRLVAAIKAILLGHGRGAAAGALTYYRLERRLAGIPGRVHLPMPELPSEAEITARVTRVVKPLYGPHDPTAEAHAQDALASEVEQLVLNQARHAVIGSAAVDAEAKGWARVTKPGACYFCAMLASRGAVYHSRETADFRAHVALPNGTGGTCRCQAEPVFNHYEPTAQIRQWMADWQRLKDEHNGKLSLIQWRRAFEGRDGTGRPPLG
jgi:hypothetical protein